MISDDSELHTAIRSELTKVVRRQKSCRTGEERAILDATLLQSHCPLLLSSFHETLRLVGAATSVRSVVEPATLASAATNTSFALQSPAVIQLPSGITHTNPAIWGSDANVFNPARFLPSTKAALDKDTKRKQAQGYFPFGGGKHLCPGRHFATTEILSFVGAIILGFDVSGSRVPERAFQKLGTAVRKPKGDVDISMKRRRGWENVKWSFSVEGRGGEEEVKNLVVGGEELGDE
ncbi:putative Cholesterol 7-alpha-monooxygenase [Glarea lozoyensis 74030]|uniref:Putative Cholesterol 7-alpha-monooxygenase n=1 Tax=Glarea lozoyensis (strain ATCC 74030 / MF5533) TaxID=1104152 RepID=H0EFV7_GLAL7|nr:putative Cholesterol 7-alpha-monooxygenase [Glarea lozoyensis 74030]